MSQSFDFNKVLKALQSGQELTDKDGNATNQTVKRSRPRC